MQLTDEAIKRAIDIIVDSKETHIDWINFIEQCPERANANAPRVSVAGGIEHHQQCINDYNHVINVLQATAEKQ
jgi:hypothetical protein